MHSVKKTSYSDYQRKEADREKESNRRAYLTLRSRIFDKRLQGNFFTILSVNVCYAIFWSCNLSKRCGQFSY